MISFVTIALTTLTLVSAVLTIRAKYLAFRIQILIFKPLTMLLIITLAIFIGYKEPASYWCWILAGFVFCLAGDLFLIFPKRFVFGLLSFLIGHLFYTKAFVAGIGFGFSYGLAIPLMLFVVIVYSVLYSYLGKMKLPVLLYVCVVVIMVWQAWERWMRVGQNTALCASVGAALFLISDFVLAVNRFRKPFKQAEFFILSTYFTAQWMIALSVGQ